MPLIPTADKQRGPRSLKRMALAVALRNIAAITDLGEMAFADAKPILMHVENPSQLHLLETNCPQLAAEPDQMAAVWRRLLTKKIPGWAAKGFLTDDDLQTMSWIDIYTTVKTATDAAMAADEARLKQTLAGFSKAKEDNATQLVNSRALLHKIPGAMAKRRGGPSGNTPGAAVLNFGSGSRTKMTTGQSVLRRARREAMEISKVSQLSSTLTNNQAVARSQIRRPPAAMINDYRVAHNPGGAGVIRAPKRRPPSSQYAQSSSLYEGGRGIPGTGLGTGNAAHEARLLALKTGTTAAITASTSASPSYAVGASAPAIHAPKKRPPVQPAVVTEQQTSKNKKKRRNDDHVSDDEDVVRGRHDFDDDDELFGVVTKPSKRPRLTVEDLEGDNGGANDEDKDEGDFDRPMAKLTRKPTSKPAPTMAPLPSRAPPSERSRPAAAVGSKNGGTPRDKTRDRLQPPRRAAADEGPSVSPPPSKSQAHTRPATVPTYAPPQPSTAGSPTRGPGLGSAGGGGGVRKKAVDIFMRPRKR